MIYLTGVHNAKIAAAAAEPDELRIGLINTPNVGYAPAVQAGYQWWAADNGCFSQGQAFSADRFTRWLDHQPRANCLFVVAPDVPFDAEATLASFWDWSTKIRALGFPVALAAQNGLEDRGVPWVLLDAIFIGGDTEWKLGHAAARIGWQAKAEGKWLHMGRVNSKKRLARALAMHCDSADGTFLRWPDTNLPRLRRWFVDLAGQTDLEDRAS